MPYYCTVPRCTSMAGKAKNVSFHQFPRDEHLAKLWNKILKRGKPYTKYSKVCSLHFKTEDYIITSVGKNKGHWRTLRKDAIPSQNLPTDSPIPHRRVQSESWMPSKSVTANVLDPQMQHVAHAIYMQTMLAMHVATTSMDSHHMSPDSPRSELSHSKDQLAETSSNQYTSSPSTSECSSEAEENRTSSLNCSECSKHFMDPDVFTLHRRKHDRTNKRSLGSGGSEKENLSVNSALTLQANPILANMLKVNADSVPDGSQLVTAMVQTYINTLTSIMKCENVSRNCDKPLDGPKAVIDKTV